MLAEEFTSNDGLPHIVVMDEDAQDYWGVRQAGVSLTCRGVRDTALRRREPVEGLTWPEVHAIAWWRPVRDAEDAWTFLAEHQHCVRRPRLDIGISWQ
ncbi:hypothetical protein [Blastococcus sp. KM273129]|uniref:hypothetical protein n=1 Tax=Blastococcus sp. KM273129 TaxID=2570315 RepID=UPI001F1A4D6D|nr:hypothetical protein [Blastococcus sp. KM273129]MCF6733630.1 hypothetical protein [Blastococcus sp. KM273129]